MDVIPSVVVTRLEQLDPGDIFLYLDGQTTFYALKTGKPASGDPCHMVTLGPQFTQGVEESFLLSWEPAPVLSFGKGCTILLATDPAAWFVAGTTRKAVCLAIAGESTYVCRNGGTGPNHYFPCFVDVKTGVIVEKRLPGITAYTNTWELAVLGANHPPRTILRFPPISAPDTAKR